MNRVALTATLALLLAACTAPGEGVDIPSTVTGANGRFAFTLEGPESLQEGSVDLTVRVARIDGGQPVDGADVAVRVTMPAMGHTSDPEAVETASGAYAVDGVLLDMPGAWVVRVRVDDAGDIDEAELPLDVP